MGKRMRNGNSSKVSDVPRGERPNQPEESPGLVIWLLVVGAGGVAAILLILGCVWIN